MPNDGFRFTPNLVVGLAITGAGGVLLLERFDMVNVRDVLRFWPVLLILFGASVVAQAWQGGGSSGPTQRPIVTPGFVIVLLVVGLIVSNTFLKRMQPRDNADTAFVAAVIGRTSRTMDSSPFGGATMTSFMGRSRLDLREATLAPGEEAVIDVFGMMGSVDVVVPEGWDVEVEAVPLMGRVHDRRIFPSRTRIEPSRAFDGEAATDTADTKRPAANAPAPRLLVRGFIMMGAVNVES